MIWYAFITSNRIFTVLENFICAYCSVFAFININAPGSCSVKFEAFLSLNDSRCFMKMPSPASYSRFDYTTRIKPNKARPWSHVLSLNSKQSRSEACPFESLWDTTFAIHFILITCINRIKYKRFVLLLGAPVTILLIERQPENSDVYG